MVSTFAYSGSDKPLRMKQDKDGTNKPVYIGEAQPGTLVTQSKWRIQKRTYAGNSINISWADGDGNYNKIWDNRKDATYTYLSD